MDIEYVFFLVPIQIICLFLDGIFKTRKNVQQKLVKYALKVEYFSGYERFYKLKFSWKTYIWYLLTVLKCLFKLFIRLIVS